LTIFNEESVFWQLESIWFFFHIKDCIESSVSKNSGDIFMYSLIEISRIGVIIYRTINLQDTNRYLRFHVLARIVTFSNCGLEFLFVKAVQNTSRRVIFKIDGKREQIWNRRYNYQWNWWIKCNFNSNIYIYLSVLTLIFQDKYFFSNINISKWIK